MYEIGKPFGMLINFQGIFDCQERFHLLHLAFLFIFFVEVFKFQLVLAYAAAKITKEAFAPKEKAVDENRNTGKRASVKKRQQA